MSFSGKDVKAALHALFANTLYPGTHVCYGDPGSFLPDTLISIGDQRLEFEPGPMSTARPREESVDTDVVFMCFVAGDVEAQKVATDAVYDLADVLGEHLRVKPNETLGGACRSATITAGALVEAKAKPRGGGVAGRLAALSITVTTQARRP